MTETVRRRRTPAADPAEPPGLPRVALTRERWIEAATEVLVDQGIDHVRVDLLATRLGVTRGSFYWHFKDREELLRAVLEAWRDYTTEQLTRRLESAPIDARQQLREVLNLPFRGRAAARTARIELAIRAWARRDATARHAVDASDAARLAYIAQLFSALGFQVAQARSRAAVVYAFIVAQSLAPALDPGSAREARNALVEDLLTRD